MSVEPERSSRKASPYLYVWHTLPEIEGVSTFNIPCASLAASVKEANADLRASVPVGHIYILYSKYAKLLRENLRLQERNDKLNFMIDVAERALGAESEIEYTPQEYQEWLANNRQLPDLTQGVGVEV